MLVFGFPRLPVRVPVVNRDAKAICDDCDIVKAARIEATLESLPKHLRRRLKDTTSEAG